MQPTADNPWPRPWPESVPLAPCPGLPLTEPLRARLRRIREHQISEYRCGRPQLVCGVFYDEEVVCLRAGGGHAAYLGTDGCVQYENYGEGKDKVLLTDPRDVASTIVKCAGDIGMPELIDLLPARPANGFVCRLCGGTAGSHRLPRVTLTAGRGAAGAVVGWGGRTPNCHDPERVTRVLVE